jgi:hypothetical protein
MLGEEITRDIIGFPGVKGRRALKICRQCPMVHLLKVGWREGKALGREESRDIGSELVCGYAAENS